MYLHIYTITILNLIPPVIIPCGIHVILVIRISIIIIIIIIITIIISIHHIYYRLRVVVCGARSKRLNSDTKHPEKCRYIYGYAFVHVYVMYRHISTCI